MPGSLALRRRRSTRPTGSLSTCGRPSRGLRRAGSGVAQVGHPGAQLVLVGAGELRQRVERALQDVGGVVRLDGEVAPLPPERPLAFVALVEARLAEPAREPGAGVAPAGGRHALHHRSRPAPAWPRRPTAPGGGARTRAVSLDVDAGQLRARELLPQHREHRPDAAADLEHTRPGLERRPVTDQPVSPVLGLRHEPLLLGGAVAVHVAPCAHAASIGADPRPRLIARRCSCPTSKAYPSWMPDDQQKGGEPPPSPRGSTPPPRRPRLPGRWWIVFGLALLAFNFYLGSRATQPASRVRIPYSPFFLQQVKADHVKQITSKGTAIQGTFTQKIRYGSAKPTTRFRTEIPTFANNDALSNLLQRKGVVVNAQPLDTGLPWWQNLLLGFGPTILFIALLFWLFRRAGNVQNVLGSFGRASARRYQPGGDKVTFADVAGIDEAKSELTEVVDFLRHPDKYRKLGGRIPHGVLLSGPPGTGKTLLARAVAGEAGVPFFSMSASQFVEAIVGIGASRVPD